MVTWNPNGSRAGGKGLYELLLYSLVLFVLIVPFAAAGQSPASDARWIPSLTFRSGVVGLNLQAGVQSAERGSAEGDGRSVYPFVGSGLELASPRIRAIWSGPRIFVHGGLELDFDLERSVAREGSAGAVTVLFVDPDGDGPTPPIFPPENRVLGTGSETGVKAGTVAFGAGAGISFSFPVDGREVRIKPSVEYRYDELELTTGLGDAVSIARDGNCPCRTLEISGQGSKAFHAIGPGLELEVDAGRTGPFMVTLFAAAQGYYVFGDRFISLRADGNFDTSEPASVVSTLRRSPWTFRGGVGLRVHWQPE